MNGYWYGRNGPGILIDALRQVGPAVAQLTVIGGVSAPIETQLTRATGHPLVVVAPGSRRELYVTLMIVWTLYGHKTRPDNRKRPQMTSVCSRESHR
ncbi:MAG: hypothetical protein WBR33_21840 [Pseudonocardiaceae bacterium]|jgi:hypothetical protein